MNTNELSCISAELHTNLYLICAPSPHEDTLGKNISYVPLKWPFIESFKRGHVLLNFFKGWREVCVRLYAWQWLSGLRSAVRLCWDPDGFNLSPATPSVTGGSRGELWLPWGSSDRGRFLWHTPCQTFEEENRNLCRIRFGIIQKYPSSGKRRSV